MSSPVLYELPLFPIQAVLYPDGVLSLKVFEARYLDLMGSCLRNAAPFGVVTLKNGAEVRHSGDSVAFETTGTTATVIDADSAQAGILQVRCHGSQRFEVKTNRQQADGLWLAQVSALPADDVTLPPPAMAGTVSGLATAIDTLKAQGSEPFLSPFRFNDAGWVANRWCEILPISLAAKQKLMELPDALVRLQLVDEFLRSKGVVA